MLKRCKPKAKSVNVLMLKAIDRLQDYVDDTDWNVCKEGINLHTFIEIFTPKKVLSWRLFSM